MLLLKGEIEALSINGKNYKIITNARYWLNNIKKLEMSVTDNERALILLSCIETDVSQTKQSIINRLLERIQEFYLCAHEKCNNYKSKNSNNKTLYDFNVDGGRIYSAFFRTYNMDIEKELDTMHWWKFMALFNDLSNETVLCGYYMHYRGYDKSIDEYKKASKETKQKIDEQISIVSIEGNINSVLQEDSPLEKRRKNAQKEKKLKEEIQGQ
jgi:hypothetical protein